MPSALMGAVAAMDSATSVDITSKPVSNGMDRSLNAKMMIAAVLASRQLDNVVM